MKAQYSQITKDSIPDQVRSKHSVPGNEGVKTEISTTINRTCEELFNFWRNFENLPVVLKHLESVRCLSATRSKWRVRVAEDKYVEWEAEIINERSNEMIAWRTLEGSDVQHAGSIWFRPAPGGTGTEVKLAVEYGAAKFADFMAKILRRSPEQQIREDLRHFKQIMETGEIPTTLGQSAGRTEDKTEKYEECAVRALCWHGKEKVQVDTVPDPTILNPRDAIIRITSTAICGSDLHLYNGVVKTMEAGDILGHEFMGEVVETASGVKNLRAGDRVVVPFTIACGQCAYCMQNLWSLCDNSNPNAWIPEKAYGQTPSGLFGFSHMLGGYAGGQAEFVRVPFADVGPLKVPSGIADDKLLFLSDIFPTGYAAVERCKIKPTDVVAVWGCGPVGQMAIRSALILGAERVIAIDRYAARLALAQRGGAETIDYGDCGDLDEELKSRTGGRGPDVCVDAVGMEAHGTTAVAKLDRVKQALMLETDRPYVLRQVIQCCRKGGQVSLPGVYIGLVDKFPIGTAFGKGLTLTMGQTHMHKYMRPLFELIESGRIDPSEIITHRVSLEDAPEAYRLFRDKQDDAVKFVLTPGAPPVLSIKAKTRPNWQKSSTGLGGCSEATIAQN